jgi:hypothetical protein
VKRPPKRGKPRRELFECPNCGADVPVGAKACRECGSDAATGWQSGEEIDYQGIELPEGYAVDPEHPGAVVQDKRPPWVPLVAIVLVAALLLWLILR